MVYGCYTHSGIHLCIRFLGALSRARFQHSIVAIYIVINDAYGCVSHSTEWRSVFLLADCQSVFSFRSPPPPPLVYQFFFTTITGMPGYGPYGESLRSMQRSGSSKSFSREHLSVYRYWTYVNSERSLKWHAINYSFINNAGRGFGRFIFFQSFLFSSSSSSALLLSLCLSTKLLFSDTSSSSSSSHYGWASVRADGMATPSAHRLQTWTSCREFYLIKSNLRVYTCHPPLAAAKASSSVAAFGFEENCEKTCAALPSNSVRSCGFVCRWRVFQPEDVPVFSFFSFWPIWTSNFVY